MPPAPTPPTARIRLFVAACTLPGVAVAVLTWGLLRPRLAPGLADAICVRDYLNLWAAGRLARLGDLATLFHPAQYLDWLRAQTGAELAVHTWSYPPPMVALAIPLSLLPLAPGFVAWGAGTLAALWRVLRACRLPPLTCLAVMLSPAAIEDALLGQNGALTACMLEGGLLLVDRSPVLSGVLFGCLTSKPQLGILLPVCLVAARRWRTVAAAAVTAGVLVLASGAAFGPSSWGWYWSDVRPFMTAAVLERPYAGSFQAMIATPFILLRWLHVPLPWAYAMQGGITAGCGALAWRAWRMPQADPKPRMALTAALALLATPYGYSYDTVGAAVGIAVLASQAVQTGFRPLERVLLAAAWAWPGWAFWFGIAGIPPVGCLTLAGVAYCAWRRLHLSSP